jgi:ABC-type sugar transport system substrate-binding protein
MSKGSRLRLRRRDPPELPRHRNRRSPVCHGRPRQSHGAHREPPHRHPDLAGVFADNESSSAGAVQALKSRNARHVKLVAFDTSDQLLADMKAGWIDSFVVQNPFKMGYESTRAVGLRLNGETPPRQVDSGAALILPEDLDKPEIQALLFPDIDTYLKRRR